MFPQCLGLTKSLFRLLDKNLTYHRHIAYMICILSGKCGGFGYRGSYMCLGFMCSCENDFCGVSVTLSPYPHGGQCFSACPVRYTLGVHHKKQVCSRCYVAIHIGAHVFNFERLAAAWDEDEESLRYRLSAQFEDTETNTRLNPIRSRGVVRVAGCR